MKESIRQIEEAALAEIASSANNKEGLEAIRVKYLGRRGLITELFKKMSEVPPEEKGEIGRLINVLKDTVTKTLDEKLRSAAVVEEGKGEAIDITLPGISDRPGKIHPITKTIY